MNQFLLILILLLSVVGIDTVQTPKQVGGISFRDMKQASFGNLLR